MDSEVKVIMRILNEHDSRLALLASKVKWLEKENNALTKRLDNQRVNCGDGRLRTVR